jgi:hypothetical protein
MYQLLAKAKDNIQTYNLTGTIGAESFTKDNVIRGTFKITNQCTDTSNFMLGGVYIGELTATFTGMNINRNAWVGLEITASVSVNNSATIPIGVYKIYSAEHSNGLTTVKAFDHMDNFDRSAAWTQGSSGDPYDILALACSECGVTLGMTRAQVEAMPNGNLPLTMGTQGDVETWRDVIYWVAVSLCAFATIDRAGHLVLRNYHSTVDDSYPADVREMNSTYGDEIVTYTGIYINDEVNEQSLYYHASVDNGYTLNIGTNPFFQTTEAQRQVYAANILNGLSEIAYCNQQVTIPFGIHYDLGDVLLLPNGFGSATNKFCIMYYAWTYDGDYQMKGIPWNKQGMSKSDKNIQGLINKTSKNETGFYELKNVAAIHIGDTEKKQICQLKLAASTDTKASIHIEVNLVSLAKATSKSYQPDAGNLIYLQDIWDDIADMAVRGIVSYLVDSVEDPLHPEETWVDGDHVLHLMYILPMAAGVINTFRVYMESKGGSIDIDMGGLWLFAFGVGLVGDSKWDGTIDVEEVAPGWQLIEVTFDASQESVVVDLDTPTAVTITDPTSSWGISETTYSGSTESLTIMVYTAKFGLITEDEETFLTEDGDVLVTEYD